jgi:hypothetical protein
MPSPLLTRRRCREGDVITVMLNGGIGGIHEKLLSALRSG